ncbi:trans-sulfuration enzyme family protein [Acidobacteriota bacterium]
MSIKYKQATIAIHGDESNKGKSEPVTTPIYQSSTYIFPDTDAMEGYMSRGEKQQHVYMRYGNPAQDQLNRRLALLECTEDALVFSSGMAAITSAVLSVLHKGDELLAIATLYGQTLNFLREALPEQYGISSRFIQLDELYNLEAHVTEKTKLLYLESPTNPNLQIVDIPRVVEQARRIGLKTMMDNTFATPINQQPISLGVDYVVHSATKYLGGHSDILAGVAAGPKDFIHECNERMHVYGPTLDPFATFLMLRSLKTLEVRIHRQNENAMKLARFFRDHPKVTRVCYPGLPDDPFHETAKKQMQGFGGIVTIEIEGGKREAMNLVDRLDMCLNATSLGGVETLVSIPVISSHAWQTEEELELAKITPQMIRFSVGLEDPDDILADCDQALNGI